MLIEIILLTIWFFTAITAFRYMRHLFGDLKLNWGFASMTVWACICVAGPAALVCGVVVDATRPIL